MVEKKEASLSQFRLILMITTTVYSFSSMSNAFYLMGYAAIPWYFVAAILFFIPYTFIVSELSSTYRNQEGGLYTWLKSSLSERSAFIATFLWYSSYILWMTSVFMKLWIPFSIFIFGQDQTKSDWQFLGLSNRQIVGIMAVLAVVVVTKLVNLGFKQVSRMMLLGGTLVLTLFGISILGNSYLLFKNGGQLAEPLRNGVSFVASPNPNYGGILGNLAFFTFGITAFGGLDTVASMVDQVKNAQKRFPIALLIGTFFIVCNYLLGIMLWGSSVTWKTLLSGEGIHLGNVMYVLMENLGYQVAIAAGASVQTAGMIAHLLVRYTGFSIFFVYIGLLSSIIYVPLKSLLSGTPEGYWSPLVKKRNKHNIHYNAMWLQCICVSGFILLVSFGGKHINELYNQLTLMTNVSRSLPYMLVAFSFPAFKRTKTDNNSFSVLKNKKSYYWASVSVVCSIFLSILFTIIQPLVQHDYHTVFFLLIGPLFFAFIGLFLQKVLEEKKVHVTVD
ncbi:glutamate/gamma-aminobutyrate family transporter YjeM [Vagococcus fessus]|uniref:Glutamate/gamma-aminobutyrate family transporter YjeM n=1 Tax=Vagococcus fessus TaxID=120370 RepID=A0A430AD03_9ENTE|nr:glutamate/gamma-aminobutyrate family transporter YjeM [Vagococcus fessus]RSU05083.1 glutamate/gamma-aminobutyrate family transporter YjeM [Vagococcus fessus]